LGVERVVATTYEKNKSSQRVMEKLGMKQVRQFRMSSEDLQNSDTSYVDTMDSWNGFDFEYAIEKIEWMQEHSSRILKEHS
jgi:RimJ/RimL family protein N-acetyltransferase